MQAKRYHTLLLVAATLFIFPVINAQVVINEYSCSNLSGFEDNYASYEDWVEL
jgi:hypothetical protein